MPSGLDGNPNPVRSAQRDPLLAEVAERVCAFHQSTVFVAVDGAPAAGKSTFADELARRIRSRGQSVVRSTTDSFHNPRAVRGRRGLASAEGYFLDSHDIDVLKSDLLEPLRTGRPFRTAHFDEPSDRAVTEVWHEPSADLVLVFDGLFLQRPELASYWDFSIFLDADKRRELNFEKWSATADRAQVAFATRRYRHGWDLYVQQCSPSQRADWVVENSDFEKPVRLR